MPPSSRKRRLEVQEPDEDEASQPDEEMPRNSHQRKRRSPALEGSDDDESDGTIAPEELETEEDENEGSMDQLVKKFVRYALACEYSRIPIKRDGMREKVFGKHKTPFKKVFDAAQIQLQKKFGMMMVELPSKEKITLRDRRAAAQKVSQPVTTSNSYILTSTLPPKFRTPAILAPSIIPTAATEAAFVGLYTLIIALITLSGGHLADAKLIRHLTRLNADVNFPMDKTEVMLQKMIKLGYLVRTKDSSGGDEVIEWSVGPRGKLEVGNKGITGLVMDLYGNERPDDLADRVKSSLGLATVPVEEEEENEAATPDVRENSERRASGRRRRAIETEDD